MVTPAFNAGGLAIPGAPKSDPVGGSPWVALYIKLGPGERMDPSMSTVTIKAQDNYHYTVMPPAEMEEVVSLSDATQWIEEMNPGTAQQYWKQATDAPNCSDGNQTGSETRVFCHLLVWNTRTEPSLPFTPAMGHNGYHTISISQVNGAVGSDLLFQHYNVPDWQTAYSAPVTSQTANVKNLVITNVSTSNGTQDYFKYDPDPSSPNNRPTINFTIEDDGDPQQYDAFVLMWPTGATGSLFQQMSTADAVDWTGVSHVGTGAVAIGWDGSPVPPGTAGYSADTAGWGTYAFEICAFEYPDDTRSQDASDWFYLRWPYCLTISNDEHSAWSDDSLTSTGVDSKLRCNYTLRDAASQAADPNYQAPSSLTLTPIDSLLAEQNCTENVTDPTAIDTLHNGADGNGIVACDLTGNYTALWRVVFTGEDSCWAEYRRDHQNSRMLATNGLGEAMIPVPWLAGIRLYLGGAAAADGAAAGAGAAAAVLGPVVAWAAGMWAAWSVGNWIADTYMMPSGEASPPLWQCPDKWVRHIWLRHGPDWGMPPFDPGDPTKMAKLIAKLQLTLFTMWSAWQRSQPGFASWDEIFQKVGGAYESIPQTVYVQAEQCAGVLEWRVLYVRNLDVINGWVIKTPTSEGLLRALVNANHIPKIGSAGVEALLKGRSVVPPGW